MGLLSGASSSAENRPHAARRLLNAALGGANTKTFSAEEQHRLALAALAQNKLDKAAQTARTAIELAPAYAHHTLARIYLSQHRPDDALQSAQAAVAAAPAYAEAYHTLAQCHIAKGHLEGAIDPLRNAIEQAPQYAEAYFTLGKVFRELQRSDDAEKAFRDALSIKPDYIEAMNYLSLVLQDEGRLDEAEAMLRKTIALRSDYAEAHDNLGFVLRELGRADEAAASFKIAHTMFEPHLVLHQPQTLVGRRLDRARRYARAVRDIALWRATGSAPHDAWTQYRMLHQATNGASSDLISSIFRRVSGVRSPSTWRPSPIFPCIDEHDVKRILSALDRDGLYVFDRSIAADLVDEMVRYARTTDAGLYPAPMGAQIRAVFDPNSPLTAGYYLDEEPMLVRPVFQQFAGDPLLLAIAERYFGVEPRLAYLVLWWSAVLSRKPMAHMAQLFHADLAHIKWLKTFVYVTDVTDGTGPHSFVKGSHKADREGFELRQRGLLRLSDEDVLKAYGDDRVVDLVGPRGTVFIADTRGFHKGHNPRTGHRLVLQVYHVNSLFPDAQGKKQRQLAPTEPTLIETVRRHPKVFAGYTVRNKS
jgi:tetratricopeptide (TPR) repeat protein